MATFDPPTPTGVAVVHTGRIFANFPRWGDDVPAGHVYVTAHELHRQPAYQYGNDLRRKPYALFRIRIDAGPVLPGGEDHPRPGSAGGQHRRGGTARNVGARSSPAASVGAILDRTPYQVAATAATQLTQRVRAHTTETNPAPFAEVIGPTTSLLVTPNGHPAPSRYAGVLP